MLKYFIQWSCFLSASVNLCIADLPKINFFADPQTLTTSKLLEELDFKSLDMCWQFGENDFFHFITKKNEVYFEVLFNKIPSSYGKSVCDFFISQPDGSGDKEKQHSMFSYESTINGDTFINQPRRHKQALGSNNSMYLVDQRRIFEKSNPQSITANDIASIICRHNVIFYTGAGISIASGVPSMNQLHDLLKLNEKEKFIKSLQNVVRNPTQFAEKLNKIHYAFYFSPPTEAHKALTQLAIFKNCKILTENLDCLHEYSGILPYRINPEQLRKDIDTHHLTQIDYIICLGLSYDDRGFLGWYKRHNPKGKIIAIDLETPSYLGDEDYLLKTDLQVLVPMLAKQITQNH